MLKKIFTKKSHSVESLVQDFQAIQDRKKALVNEIEKAKRDALTGDIKAVAAEIQKLEIERELTDSGLEEIRSLMAEVIEKNIQDDYKSLPAREKKINAEYAKASHQAGVLLGEAVLILSALGRPCMTTIAGAIREAYANAAKIEKFADDIKGFSSGFASAKTQAKPLQNFVQERKAITAIQGRQPGSDGALNHVKNRVNRLLTQ